jgi:ABC-type multidrug transport system fused ATPase/permease subunit
MPYTANDFYKDELNRLEKKQQNAESITQSQMRLTDMNDSYRKRYSKYVQVLMVLVFAYALYLAVILLQKMFPVIPQIVIDVITVVLIFLVAFYLFNTAWELYSRSLLNYDELDLLQNDSSGVDVSKLAEEGQIFDFQGTELTCIGQDCCPEDTHTYDSDTNKCVLTSTLPSNKKDSPTNNPQVVSPTNPSIPTPPSIPNNPLIQPFATLEYENVSSAYNLSIMNAAGELKRVPNGNNATPFQTKSALVYSNF